MTSRLFPLLGCLAIVAAAATFIAWTSVGRGARIREVSALGSGAQPDAESPTGYARGVRNRIIPDVQHASYQWLMQAEDAARRGAWRVRHVDYDNAPLGRETRLASPYRWWLQATAAADRAISGRGIGPAFEESALRAGPALQLIVVAATAGFAAWRFGLLAAGLAAAGLVLLFPLAGGFVAGHPDDLGLKAAVALWSVLLLVAGIQAPAATVRHWFAAAGAAAGLGLWVNAVSQLAVLLGLWVGGLALHSRSAAPALPWRTWAGAGAIVSLAAWLWEFAPAHLAGLRLGSNHPLHAIAWLGAAELLMRFGDWRATGRKPAGRASWTAVVVAGLAVAALPVALVLAPGSISAAAAANVNQLTVLRGGIAAESTAAWLARDGFGASAWATLAPVFGAVAAAGLALRAAQSPSARGAMILTLGPVAVLAALACFQLHWWSLLDGALLALALGASAALPTLRYKAGGLVVAVAILLPGLALLRPPASAAADEVMAAEVDALVTRDLAHWLAGRAPEDGVIVLAPPALTAGLVYYGGFRGISTPWWENQDGFAAAVRIAATTSADEALALVQRRRITHLVLPSWDDSLGEYARLGGGQFEHTLAGLLGQWLPPRWLRPLPYQLPGIAGLESRHVRVFEVVEAQDNPTALGRLAEYFLETGQAELAGSVASALQHSFPQELAALAARAHVDFARRDGAALNATLSAIDDALAQGADEILPWERRISLALALGQARRMDRAREMIANALEGADDERLRSLTPGTLYRLLVFCRVTGLEFPDAALRQSALQLLPPEWRAHF